MAAHVPSGIALTLVSLLLCCTSLLEASPFNEHDRYQHRYHMAQASQSRNFRSSMRSSYMDVSHSADSYSSGFATPQYRPTQPIPAVPSQYGSADHPMAQLYVLPYPNTHSSRRRSVVVAQRLADTCAFRHTDNNPYGENIAAGQASPKEVVSQWIEGPEEKLAYDPSNPRDSHFTQVVWEASREVGCAVRSCPSMAGVNLPQSPIQFWVCEYNPPGNVATLYTKNVHANAGGSVWPAQSCVRSSKVCVISQIGFENPFCDITMTCENSIALMTVVIGPDQNNQFDGELF
ncbi:uncharacterized protein VP01_3328g1 [Puccinia sorghi]|uniref:SCP domain-containing protein n=1 Tax=Puccinia sorghi TaxID=27349 RepID=A0A0L6UZ42_9BASI|nr:uncharacterized protein VP01_3328g1 [Puccinia sorghi]